MNLLERTPREIVYFAGIGLYGFVTGLIYWFLTYEVAGSVLLTVFGAAALGFATVLALSLRGRRREPTTMSTAIAAPEGPFGSEPGRIPTSSLAPLELGFGLAVASLSLVYGVWMLIAAAVPVGAGAITWIRSAERELASTAGEDATISAPPRAAPPSA
jgi:Cytochrome c oxidase subunit IV